MEIATFRVVTNEMKMAQPALKHGDFTGLAENYSRYRPGYSRSVRDALLAMCSSDVAAMKVADVGAGTGIWTRLMAERVAHVTAVEPNEDMRRCGIRDSQGQRVTYREGSGEATGLPDQSVDMVSMASSFHWVDFERGLREFRRILKPGGRFVALWNPRLIEINPFLVEVEDYIKSLCPTMKRVSSGGSGITETLTEKLWASGLFDDVVYLEGRHTAEQTPEHYIGVWRSVNDIQVQMGPENWAKFLAWLGQRTAGMDKIATTYRTRAWSARKI
jgi:ubiquinone/menaquinone biosynthesis C-methylase UbiE